MRMKNETDPNKVVLKGILNNQLNMAVKIAMSSVKSEPLSPIQLEKILKACEIVLDLDESKEKLLRFIESRMLYIAPNLSKI